MLCLFIPASLTLRRGAQGKVLPRCFRDIGQLVRQRTVLRTLVDVRTSSGASFALTNSLGGLGHQFAIAEGMVALIAGTGVTAAAIMRQHACSSDPQAAFGAAAVSDGRQYRGLLHVAAHRAAAHPRDLRPSVDRGERVPGRLPSPSKQRSCSRSIGEDNPLAATQFALLQAATALPSPICRRSTARAYGHGGIPSMFLADAGLSLVACVILLPLVLRWNRLKNRGADAQTIARVSRRSLLTSPASCDGCRGRPDAQQFRPASTSGP